MFAVVGLLTTRFPRLAGLSLLWAFYRAFHDVRVQRNDAQRDPNEVGAIRVMLAKRKNEARSQIVRIYADVAASPYGGNGERVVQLGTRGQHASQWRADTRDDIERLLPGRVSEFEAQADLVQDGKRYDTPYHVDNGDEFNALMGQLEREARWLDEMHTLIGGHLV